jgi:hypothetical protein
MLLLQIQGCLAKVAIPFVACEDVRSMCFHFVGFFFFFFISFLIASFDISFVYPSNLSRYKF